jgi:branched-chain amino acid transport system substrate-binding protein
MARGAAAAALLLTAAPLATVAGAVDRQQAGGLTVGALLPLTGSLASYGETSRAALEAGVADLNARSGAAGQHVTLIVEDTATDPATARAKLESLNARGVKLVIGPYASSEVAQAKPVADANGILLISPLSTARSLTLPGDNVFRFTPDDEQEGVAVAGLALADGVNAIVPMTRDDAGNHGLQDAMRAAFEAKGGVVLDPVVYGATQTEFSAELQQVNDMIGEAQQQYGTVGVYLTAVGEVADLFEQASSMGLPRLTSVHWYGSDSVAQSADLVQDRTAAAFAVQADYPNPILGLDESSRGTWGPLVDRLTAQLGRQPDSFALAAYDALQVAYRAAGTTGAMADVESLKAAVVRTAATYSGATGPATLNAAGDRALAVYDFWAVCATPTDYDWFRVATFAPSEGGESQVARQTCAEAMAPAAPAATPTPVPVVIGK